jgi:5-hydroxyisourate hydrolase-like protein (transthyretin family)
MRRFTRTALTTWALAFAVVACGDDPVQPDPLEPTTLSIVSGDAQTLDAGATSAALTVQVLDQNSDPMEGVTVTFTGSGVAHTLSGQSASTGSNGQASVTVTAGDAAGAITVEAAVSGLDVTFNLDVEIPPTATSLTIVSGDGQALDFEAVSEALVVEVLDQNDAPMEGVTVTFTGSGASHTLSAGTAETGADGRAEITVTAGTTEGAIEVEAAVAGLDVVVFNLTVEQVLAPTTITVVSGDAQSLDFNEVSAPLVVEVLDQNNDPMEGLTVTFAGTGVDHSLSAETAATGADGRAEITVTAGVVDGTIEVEASAGELTPVVFGLTVVDGPFSVTAPDNIRGITFDGTWLWAVAGPDAAPLIYQLDATDGSVQQSFSAPAADHRGLTFDGTNLWYSSDATETIYRLDPSNGAVLSFFASPGTEPRGLAWDGTTLWHNDRTGGVGTVYQLDPSNGDVLDQFASPVNDPLGLTWDGTHLWTAQLDAVVADRTLVRFDTNGVFDSELPNPGTTQIGLTFDAAGPWLWSADTNEGVIHRIKLNP